MFYVKENSTLINVCVCSELFMFLLLWSKGSEVLQIEFRTLNICHFHILIMPEVCANELVDPSYLPDRSERRVQHHGPLWAWAEASCRICLHHAQSHEWSGELSILLTNTLTEDAEPGQTGQVRQKMRFMKSVVSVMYFEYNYKHFFSCFNFCQSAAFHFAPWDQWHYRSSWIFR